MHQQEFPKHYRPQFRVRWRSLARALDRFPRLKAHLGEAIRRILTRVFAPGLVTTERVIEYPFVFQNLDGAHGPVLDLGCAGSLLPIQLASRGFRVIGMEVRAYPFRHANFSAVRGDATKMPLREASVGVVLAISSIEHFGIGHYGDPTAESGDRLAIEELARVLRPGGRALITVPYGVVRTDHFQRVYDSARLDHLLKPLTIVRREFARSLEGLWTPCAEAEAASVDWAGPTRAVALIVATLKSR